MMIAGTRPNVKINESCSGELILKQMTRRKISNANGGRDISSVNDRL